MRKPIYALIAVLLNQPAMADLLEDPVIASSLPRIVTADENGKTFALAVGQCLDVRLSTQAASTGYDWFLAPGLSEAVSLAARTVTTAGNAMPGAPAQLDYILCAAALGTVAVTFRNYRVWEKHTPPAKTLSFTVTITP
ncbi:MAG: protease inhibitor I42 family protein [Rhizomicrobium sp.]|nr:protease inhibitor I42 family protein [Rhizomicrobium sp.]